MKSALIKYNLPKKIEIVVHQVKEGGFVVEFPSLQGCFTQASNLFELDQQVTDAVLTYFDVPRKDASQIAYLPEEKNVKSKSLLPKINLETNFDLFLAA